jgi:flagellar hook protein FlgE
MNPIATAQYGLMAASRAFEASAMRTAAAAPGRDTDLTREVVEQVTARRAFSANLGVLRTADAMIGDLLDLIV